MDPASVIVATALDPVPGVIRRSTTEVLERLAQAASRPPTHSKWYEPGKDFW